MADPGIVEIVRRYLAALPRVGIHPTMGIVFGSHARGQAGEWSDIDLLVVAPEFDEPRPIPVKSAARLWAIAREIDVRIEPLPCGVKEWKEPHVRQIVDVAAREGQRVAA
jgi:predicted nucleotidyltransferase